MLCHCDCGNEIVARICDLKSGKVKSCGCLIREFNKTKIGNSYSSKRQCVYEEKERISLPHYKRIKRIWKNMKSRCNNPKATGYHNYGGRGIKVCKEWSSKNGLMLFYQWAISNGYQDDLSIDRIDNNKGYFPENCRWATAQQQRLNQR